MALYGYARVSTEDQSTAAQAYELQKAGCVRVVTEHASGGDADRPALKALLAELSPGDTLIIYRLDRLARSLRDLMNIVSDLSARGIGFKSLSDPVDTNSPQGMFAMQVLGAAAELERALIKERTRSGLERARREGRQPGNPGLKNADPAAVRKIKQAKDAAHMEKLHAEAIQWLPEVQRMRPQLPWEAVLNAINARQTKQGGAHWTMGRLKRAVDRFVREGLLDAVVQQRAPRPAPDDRIMIIIAGMLGADPSLTLRDIGQRLENMYERTPRGGRNWSPSSVKMFLDRARENGLIPDAPGLDSRSAAG